LMRLKKELMAGVWCAGKGWGAGRRGLMRQCFRRRGHGRGGGNGLGKVLLGAGPEMWKERQATWRPAELGEREGCNSRTQRLGRLAR
jgi:hypothetical protein